MERVVKTVVLHVRDRFQRFPVSSEVMKVEAFDFWGSSAGIDPDTILCSLELLKLSTTITNCEETDLRKHIFCLMYMTWGPDGHRLCL